MNLGKQKYIQKYVNLLSKNHELKQTLVDLNLSLSSNTKIIKGGPNAWQY